MSASMEFQRLARAADEELAELVRVGGRVDPADVADSTWRGWNRSVVFGVLRSRKFFKRFLPPGPSGRFRGENILARQNGLDAPWRERLRGRGILPFGVLAPGEGPVPDAPAQALVIAYGAVRSPLNPLGRVVDHLVRPDAARPDLLVGESILLLAAGRSLLIEHFLLERSGQAR